MYYNISDPVGNIGIYAFECRMSRCGDLRAYMGKTGGLHSTRRRRVGGIVSAVVEVKIIEKKMYKIRTRGGKSEVRECAFFFYLLLFLLSPFRSSVYNPRYLYIYLYTIICTCSLSVSLYIYTPILCSRTLHVL